MSEKRDSSIGRGELAILGVLVMVGVAAVPFVRDVQLLNSIFLSICHGLGL